MTSHGTSLSTWTDQRGCSSCQRALGTGTAAAVAAAAVVVAAAEAAGRAVVGHTSTAASGSYQRGLRGAVAQIRAAAGPKERRQH